MADPTAGVVALLDGARRPLLRAVVRVAPLKRLFVDRRARVLTGALVADATSFAVAAWQPLVALWLGAALLGVPHVVAGVRQVALRDRLQPLTRGLCAVALAVGVVELAASGTRIADGAVRAYVVLFSAAIGTELWARAGRRWPRGSPPRRFLAAAVALPAPRLALLALAHLHGLGAVAWFVQRARARGVPVWPFVAAVAAVMLGAAVGAFDALWSTTLWAPRSAAASIAAEAAGSSFTAASGVVLRRALFLYSFGQALHFAIWPPWCPISRPQSRAAQLPPRAGALRGRLRTLGRARSWSVASPPRRSCLLGGGVAREAYFALTYFHVGLEAAGGGYFFVAAISRRDERLHRILVPLLDAPPDVVGGRAIAGRFVREPQDVEVLDVIVLGRIDGLGRVARGLGVAALDREVGCQHRQPVVLIGQTRQLLVARARFVGGLGVGLVASR